ncbi:MAG: hypothetical protein WA160_05225 [Pseudobdellovibrio sp.]
MTTNQFKPVLKRKFKKSEKGMAIFEAIPVLFMLALLFNFSLGFFGAVHSGILNSIASYNYTLETFRFKSNLIYFRPGGRLTNYAASQARVHGTIQDGSEDIGDNKADAGKWPATTRGITFNYKLNTPGRDLASIQDRVNNQNVKVAGSESNHNYNSTSDPNYIQTITSKYLPKVGDTIQTPRIWIKTVYGICLNAECKVKN